MTLLCPLMILRRLLLLLCCLALPALADSAPDDDESPADTTTSSLDERCIRPPSSRSIEARESSPGASSTSASTAGA